MRTLVLVGGVLALSSSGCAAIFKGPTQTVRFVATPDGSDVWVDGQHKGAAPTTAEIKRTSQTVKVSKDGFKDQHIQIRHHADTPWFVWDIATCVIPITLCIPVLVDAISGAWMSLDDEVRVKLEPQPADQRAAPTDGPPATDPHPAPNGAPRPAPAPTPSAPAPTPSAPAPGAVSL